MVYLGIDVAKAKLDCALRLASGKFRHKVVDNTPAGFKALDDWLAFCGRWSTRGGVTRGGVTFAKPGIPDDTKTFSQAGS